MRYRTFSRATAVLLAAAVVVPAAALARGGGFAHGGHGPVFGLHHPIVAHRPFRPGVQHFRAHFAAWWRLHRFARHRGGNRNGIADAGYYSGGSYGPGGSYDPGDLTGTLAPPPAVFAPPAAPPSERIGCFARGYDVPAESGGVTRVTVTRC
jgi:hypothetical protein